MSNVNGAKTTCGHRFMVKKHIKELRKKREEKLKKRRRFALVSKYVGNEDWLLPRRKTKNAAAYDLVVAEDTKLLNGDRVLVPFGFKVYMPRNEYFQISLRSGNKIPMIMMNGIGIVDADYVDNTDNEGHVMIPVLYLGFSTHQLNKGDRIAQGVFLRYGVTDCEEGLVKRVGGHGSTGE